MDELHTITVEYQTPEQVRDRAAELIGMTFRDVLGLNNRCRWTYINRGQGPTQQAAIQRMGYHLYISMPKTGLLKPCLQVKELFISNRNVSHLDEQSFRLRIATQAHRTNRHNIQLLTTASNSVLNCLQRKGLNGCADRTRLHQMQTHRYHLMVIEHKGGSNETRVSVLSFMRCKT